ncbi:hypothetical protein FQN49_002378 [Arthroderma sp. PD_2]|nr:hypothetical protein FQN49_002378 [Arthroderma sp. PD_2]
MAAQMKSIIVSYPQGTPDSVVQDAKKAITDAGGKITHEYTLIQGFSAEAPESVFDQVKTMSAEHQPAIEEDQVVSIN